MCKSKMAVNATDPNSARTRPSARTQSTRTRPSARTQSPRTATRLPTYTTTSSSSAASDQPSTSTAAATTSSATTSTTSSSTISSRPSLPSLRHSLSQNPHIYDLSEIRAATNNFLAKRLSSSSSTPCWRCVLRNADTVVFQRKFRRQLETSQLRERLSVICRSHHLSVVKLLGACISGDHIFLVYDFVAGANLADCLRNSKNPNFTILSTWLSRMQIAADLGHALDYIHNKTGLNVNLVHNHIKSSGIIVTEPSFNAKLCHFGTAQLCGEVDEDGSETAASATKSGEASELRRSDSGAMQFEGVRGYMSPEFRATGVATQKSDVYAFGVVILELLSGEEPLKYKFDRRRGDFTRTSVIDTARAAVEGGDGEDEGGAAGREGRMRKWMDRRLRDSFPVEVAEKLTRIALECVHVEADKRPGMGRVAGKISKMYLDSRNWSESYALPTEISVSLAPR